MLPYLLFFAPITLILTAGTTNNTFEVTFLQYVFMAPHDHHQHTSMVVGPEETTMQ
jgi:hypothetical protein